MNYLPSELCIYIADFSEDINLFVSLNSWFYEIFKDKLEIIKNRRLMSLVIDTLLVDMKKPAWIKQPFTSFDYYLYHHVTNSQEIESVRRWWLKKHSQHNEPVFWKNLSYVAGNTSEHTERVIREYLEDN